VLGTSTLALGLLAGGHLGKPIGDPRRVALVWALTLALSFALTGLAQHSLGVPVSQFAASPEATGMFMAILVVGFTTYVARDVPSAVAPLALLGLMPPLLTGHVRTADVPWLNGIALVLHVAGAALWAGGLLAVGYLAVVARASWLDAVRRYSPLAFGALLAVAVSGVAVALSRVTSPGDVVGSAYGVLVLGKASALLVLAGCGYLQRRHVLAARGPTRGAFVQLAGVELTLMALTFALAAALGQTPPP
jgi:putative copper export protein